MAGIKARKKNSPPRREGKAACRNFDPEMWQLFSKKLTAENRFALQVCARCPVKEWCLQVAESDPKAYAGEIWGGKVFS
jgi:Transcription factor WhiB.